MRVRWLAPALAQLDGIHGHISKHDPNVARHVFTRIRNATRHLSRFPNSGRPGQVPGTRELVVTGLAYIVVYRVELETVDVLRVFHTSQEMVQGPH